MAGDAIAKLRDLVDKAQHAGTPGLDDGGVGCGAAVREVVGEQGRGVEFGGQEADPVVATRGSPAGKRGVAERVAGGGLRAGDVEARLGVGVAAGEG